MSELVQLRRSGRARRSTAGEGAPGPAATSRRVYIETYGCQMNVSDTELMAGVLARAGYRRVEDPGEADVILVNTCAIRENAERRVRGRVGQLQRYRQERPSLVLGVTGCMAQRIGERLVDEGDRVDLVAGPDSYRRLGQVVEEIRSGRRPRGQELLALDEDEDYEGVESVRTGGVTAWITVQRGCDHRCTFCIVPYVRGSEKNRRPGRILSEARRAVEEGFTELTLLGQTVNSYEWEGWGFADLLRSVARVEGLRRLRFTSPHPNDVTAELLTVMAEEPAVCPQLHLPVQSGSDRILKRMVRRYTADEFLEKVRLAREAVAGIALSTDVIVGFPGETEDDFRRTLGLMREVRFDRAFMYRFSPREGTPATRFPEEDFVGEEVAQSRLERLIRLQRGVQREIDESEVGSVREVLVEEEARTEGDLLGTTRTHKPVAFPGEREAIGSYREVRLVGTTGATFRGAPP